MRRLSVFVCLISLFPTAPVLADPVADVPGGDIFGFSSATDVGDVGNKGVAFETTTRVGKTGGGTFVVPTLKTQFSWTPVEDTQIAASPFVTGFRARGVPGVDAKSFVGFDGLSVEASRRLIARTETNPTAVTVSAEARWSRIDGLSGNGTDGRNLTLKLFADRVLIPDQLYATVNVNLSTGTGQLWSQPSSGRTESSGSDVSAALTRQIGEALFVGAEAHWLESFTGTVADHWQGRAFTVGPTILYKLTDTMSLNAAWQAQVAGRRKGESRDLNLTDFDRHQFRLKLALSL
jgi:hypothetical protein